MFFHKSLSGRSKLLSLNWYFSSFSNSICFSVRNLLNVFLLFPCHIIFLHIIVLHLLLCGISNLTSLTKLFFCIYKFYILYWYLLTNYLFLLWICELQVIISGDVELNPGTKPSSGQNVSVCHRNLKSIPAHNFRKQYIYKLYYQPRTHATGYSFKKIFLKPCFRWF